MNRDAIIAFLAERGVDSKQHSGRLFIHHLEGTEKLLEDWGYGEEIQVAGLFHSIYGTNAFPFDKVTLDERGTVRGLIGERAEHLAYCFCVASRPRAFLEACATHALVSRHTRETFLITEEDRVALVAIEVANLIEQSAGLSFLKQVVDSPATHASGLSQGTLTAIKRHLGRYGITR